MSESPRGEDELPAPPNEALRDEAEATQNQNDDARRVDDAKRGTDAKKGILVLACVMSVPLFVVLVDEFGVKQPGALFERGQYQAECYVHIGRTSPTGTKYKLPATIRRSEGGTYWLLEVRFPNGGRAKFDDAPVSLDRDDWVKDTHDGEWLARLAREPAPRPPTYPTGR